VVDLREDRVQVGGPTDERPLVHPPYSDRASNGGQTEGREESDAVSVALGARSRAKGSTNEDAYLLDADHLLFGVFDGLGSTAQAADAARLAAESIRAAHVERRPDEGHAAELAFLPLAVRGAGTLVAATLDDGLTTASVVKLCTGGDGAAVAVICNVGDSRVYRYAATGMLQQCTLDDSVFGSDWELQLRLGEAVTPSGVLEHLYFDLRHVMDRALGDGLAEPHVWQVQVSDRDLLLAVTDGVTDNLTFSELGRLLHDGHDDPPGIARRLVDAAYDRSRQAGHPRAKVDDITAVVAQVRR
jgi:serine/threonine protein phosphatase PrpC